MASLPIRWSTGELRIDEYKVGLRLQPRFAHDGNAVKQDPPKYNYQYLIGMKVKMVSELLNVTRKGSAPGGKPSVYFCCHPEDFRSYFYAIADDILDKIDCAIYYHKDGQLFLKDENSEADIAAMQLFVMPVTENLLHTPNQAIDIGYRYAVEHGIPVLPLIQEKNLERLFNEKCGERQYLNKNDRDPTAIPYEKKLEVFLKDVLLEDELRQKISNSFNGHVFLSYRKKDRKLAQELMRKIHQNDAYRDVAIWYDEFLTPGESFRQEIREAIDRSDLFVMTVTPNLLESGNYVMTEEYPLARELKKTVLPVQMKPTEWCDLKQAFIDLPQCVDAQNDEALLFALQEYFPVVGRSMNQNPLHCFYVGLAYLVGVQVEVDKRRAVDLIAFAAEAQIPEAMRKLAFMYANGEGVERNCRMAAKWYEKLAQQTENRYRTTGAQEDAIAYMECLWKQASMLSADALWEQATDVYEKAVAFAENVTHADTIEMLYCRWQSCFLYCRVLMSVYGERSLQVVKHELSHSSSLTSKGSGRRESAEGMSQQEYHSMQSQMESSKQKTVELAKKVVQIARRMDEASKTAGQYADIPDDLCIQDKLAHSYGLLGRVFLLQMNETEEAARCFQKMLRIRESLAQQDPRKYTDDLASAYLTAGELLGDFDMRWKGLDMKVKGNDALPADVMPPTKKKYRLIDGRFQLVEVDQN